MKPIIALGLLVLAGALFARPESGPGVIEYDGQGCPVTVVEPDTSSRKKQPGRDWYDESGRRIKSVSTTGEVELYWWDEKGRLAKIAGLSYRASATDDHPEHSNSETWVHLFNYREDGSVELEMDCLGGKHACPVGAKVDPKRWSTISGHVHVWPTGHLGHKPADAHVPIPKRELWKDDEK